MEFPLKAIVHLFLSSLRLGPFFYSTHSNTFRTMEHRDVWVIKICGNHFGRHQVNQLMPVERFIVQKPVKHIFMGLNVILQISEVPESGEARSCFNKTGSNHVS